MSKLLINGSKPDWNQIRKGKVPSRTKLVGEIVQYSPKEHGKMKTIN